MTKKNSAPINRSSGATFPLSIPSGMVLGVRSPPFFELSNPRCSFGNARQNEQSSAIVAKGEVSGANANGKDRPAVLEPFAVLG